MRFSAVPSLLFAVLGLWVAKGQTSDPFPNAIPPGGIVVDVEPFAVIPRQTYVGFGPVLNELITAPDGRIFVTDQFGSIYQVSADGGTVTPYLDVYQSLKSDLVLEGPEDGLESLTFHPDFLKVGAKGYGKFYTAHTASSRDTNTPGFPEKPADFTPVGARRSIDYVLLEWQAADPIASTFAPANSAAPYREVMRIGAPDLNHTVGLAAFNPNAASGSADYGMLYIGVGDGGDERDPWQLGQDKSQPYAKILRIDPLGTNSARGNYGIPADNPFVGVSGVIAEAWAIGFRNPQRFSWDQGGAHQMFIADIGQDTVEEIDIGVPGANYGWSQREGSFIYNGLPSVGFNARSDSAFSGFTYPIAEYDHNANGTISPAAITAGFVYRSTDLPILQGKFLFGDIPSGRAFYIDADHLPNGGQDSLAELRLRFNGVERSLLQEIQRKQSATRVDLRFGRDQSGRIFLLNKQDGIIRVITNGIRTPTPTPAATPATSTSPSLKVHLSAKTILPTHAERISMRGTATANVRSIQYKQASWTRYHTAHGVRHWEFTISLQPGRNQILIRALGTDGSVSRLHRIIVRR
ncbi:MAG: PQQ-dependent sugar dehydrogenase [Terrimicrobiaceae bacterium]|nr:PQQ-dependent sugar dehydrogenase [Terrimicrobiaceae bacterium]